MRRTRPSRQPVVPPRPRRAVRLPIGKRPARRPWQRAEGPLEKVRDQLLRRKLTTVEDCRALWEAVGDPLAIAAAVMLSPTLPRWLQHAALLALVPDEAGRVITKRWPASNRDRLHAARAWQMILLRTHPRRDDPRLLLTWERAGQLASYFLRATDGSGGPAAVQQSYQRVARSLGRNPWRFWAAPDGFQARRLEALRTTRALIERALEARPST